MSDMRVTKLANLLVNYSTNVKKGDKCLVMTSLSAVPLMTEVIRAIYRAGGNVEVLLNDEELLRIKLEESDNEQLEITDELRYKAFSEFDCIFIVEGKVNSHTLTHISADKYAIYKSSMVALIKQYMSRSASGDLRWVCVNHPTNSAAQEAGMSLEAYENFVYQASFVNNDDPITEWQRVSLMHQKLIEYLKGKQMIRVVGVHVDLTFSIQDRRFVDESGKINVPSGEIFTGPVETSVNGWVYFNYPAIHAGNEVEEARLWFEDGRVVKALAKKGEEYLRAMLDLDEGSCYLGEFGIGTNRNIQQFTKQVLFDEKMWGTIHLALGGGYPETGSVNKSALHWDMIYDMKDGGKIYVDDELFYDSGEFLILES